MDDTQKLEVVDGRISGIEHELYGLELDLKAAKKAKDAGWTTSLEEAIERAKAKQGVYEDEQQKLAH